MKFVLVSRGAYIQGLIIGGGLYSGFYGMIGLDLIDLIENLVKKYDAYNVFAIKVPRRLMIQNVKISQRVRCFVGCLNRFVLRGK